MHGALLLQGLVFDYFVDEASVSMVSWETKVPQFTYVPDNFSGLFVPTVDTTRLTWFLDTLVAKKHFVMFVGNTGACFAFTVQARTARKMQYLLLSCWTACMGRLLTAGGHASLLSCLSGPLLHPHGIKCWADGL